MRRTVDLVRDSQVRQQWPRWHDVAIAAVAVVIVSLIFGRFSIFVAVPVYFLFLLSERSRD